MSDSIPMTAEEVQRLRDELEHLKTTGRRHSREELAKAMSFGDFRENSELDEAKRAHSVLEGRIADLQTLLGRAKVVSAPPPQREDAVEREAVNELGDHK